MDCKDTKQFENEIISKFENGVLVLNYCDLGRKIYLDEGKFISYINFPRIDHRSY